MHVVRLRGWLDLTTANRVGASTLHGLELSTWARQSLVITCLATAPRGHCPGSDIGIQLKRRLDIVTTTQLPVNTYLPVSGVAVEGLATEFMSEPITVRTPIAARESSLCSVRISTQFPFLGKSLHPEPCSGP